MSPPSVAKVRQVKQFAESLGLDERQEACAVHVGRLLLRGLAKTIEDVAREMGVEKDTANRIVEAGMAIALKAMQAAREDSK